MRVAVAAGPGRTALLQELAEDGSGYAAPALVNDFPAAVAEYERARPGGEHVRWVWADTSAIYPSLLHGGVRVDRCHDAALTEALLRAREGTGLSATGQPSTGQPGTGRRPARVCPARVCPARVCPPRARRAGHPPPGKPPCSARPSPGVAEAREVLRALVGVHADQLRRIAADTHPARFGLLAAVESAGGLAAAEMSARGMPWRADVHDALLAGLLGRPARAGVPAAPAGRPGSPDLRRVRRPPGQPRLPGAAAEGVRRPTASRSSPPALAVLREASTIPAVPLLARVQGAGAAARGARLGLAGRVGPRRPVPPGVRGRAEWFRAGGPAAAAARCRFRGWCAARSSRIPAGCWWSRTRRNWSRGCSPRSPAITPSRRRPAPATCTQALAGAFGGDRAKAKVALLSAMYGGAGGEAAQLLAVLRRRFPRADAYVEAAARAGEEGRVVRSRLGRTCPPPSAAVAGPDRVGRRARHR